jgi:hypothetical protein
MNLGPETFEDLDFDDVLGVEKRLGQPVWLINDVLRGSSDDNTEDKRVNSIVQPSRPKAPMRSSMNIYRNYSIQSHVDSNEKGNEVKITLNEIKTNKDHNEEHNEVIDQLLNKFKETQRRKKDKKERSYKIALEKRKRFVSLTPRTQSPKTRSDAAASPSGSFNGNNGSFRKGSANFRRHSINSTVGNSSIHSRPPEDSIIEKASGVVQYNMDVLQAQEKFFTFIFAAHSATIFIKILRIKNIQRKYAAMKIQRCYWRHRYRKAILRLKNIPLPIRAVVKMKISRKNHCVNIIKTFVSEYIKEAANLNTKYLIKQYCKKIRACQRFVRKYVIVLRARWVALGLLWEKHEKRYRQKCEESELVQLEEKKKDIAKRIMSGRMTNSVPHKWEKLHTNVQQLLYRADMLSLEGNRLNHLLAVDADTEGVSNTAKDSSKSKKKAGLSLSTSLDRIASEERSALIKTHLRMKRKIHIQLTDEKKFALIKAGEVGVEHAKLLISMDNVDSDQADIMSRLVKLQLETATNPQVIKARRNQAYTLFTPLTSKVYGKSWKELVELAVNADIEAKKKG